MKLGDIVLAGLVVLFVIACPYTKVEESFNLQATHDLIIHKTHLEKYDHFEFPGVVPRTFVGPIIIAILSWPFAFLFATLQISKAYLQYVVRIALGLLLAYSFSLFRKQVSLQFGNNIAKYFILITCCQFHLIFYMSRTLPNTFALFFVMLAFTFWLQRDYVKAIFFFTFTIFVFRSEVLVLCGPLMLHALLTRELNFFRMVFLGIISLVISLALSVGVDSLLWEPWMWAEGVVFWYNAILGKSVNWGTSPFHWYFTSAIPKAMMFTLFFIPFSFSDKRVIRLLFPVVTFVTIYSNLPHKELRFIFYALPIFNLVAAIGFNNVIVWSRKSKLYQLVSKLFFLMLLLTLIASCGILLISSENYPGGYAFKALHDQHKHLQNQNIQVHIDVAAAQQGVSRFGEIYDNWSYSKDESVTDFTKYDLLLNEKKDIPGFSEVYVANRYNGIDWHAGRISTSPAIYVLRNNNLASVF